MSSLLEKVQATYAAIAALPAPSDKFENLHWVEMKGGPYGGVYTTPDEIRQGVFDNLGGQWEGFKLNPELFLEPEGYVVVVGTYTGRYRATGKELSARVIHLWSEKDGGLVFEQFADTALLYEAMK